jgi:hypothetical protein
MGAASTTTSPAFVATGVEYVSVPVLAEARAWLLLRTGVKGSTPSYESEPETRASTIAGTWTVTVSEPAGGATSVQSSDVTPGPSLRICRVRGCEPKVTEVAPAGPFVVTPATRIMWLPAPIVCAQLWLEHEKHWPRPLESSAIWAEAGKAARSSASARRVFPKPQRHSGNTTLRTLQARVGENGALVSLRYRWRRNHPLEGNRCLRVKRF